MMVRTLGLADSDFIYHTMLDGKAVPLYTLGLDLGRGKGVKEIMVACVSVTVLGVSFLLAE